MTFLSGLALVGATFAGLFCALIGFRLGWALQPLFISDLERFTQDKVKQMSTRLLTALVSAGLAGGLAIIGIMQILPASVSKSIETILEPTKAAPAVTPFTSTAAVVVNPTAVAQQRSLLNAEKEAFLQQQESVAPQTIATTESAVPLTPANTINTQSAQLSAALQPSAPPSAPHSAPDASRAANVRLKNELIFINNKITELSSQWGDARSVLDHNKPAPGQTWQEGEAPYYIYTAARQACDEVEQAAVVLKADKARVEAALKTVPSP